MPAHAYNSNNNNNDDNNDNNNNNNNNIFFVIRSNELFLWYYRSDFLKWNQLFLFLTVLFVFRITKFQTRKKITEKVRSFFRTELYLNCTFGSNLKER